MCKEDKTRSLLSAARRPRQGIRTFATCLRSRLRARAAYYAESAPLIGMVHRDSQTSLWALIEIYRACSEKIEASGYDVMNHRIRLSGVEKVTIVANALLIPRLVPIR